MKLLPEKRKKFILEFKAPNFKEDPRPAIYISEIGAENLRYALANKDLKFIDLHNDEGDFIETISKSDIKGIRRLDEQTEQVKNDDYIRYAVCEYGTPHKYLGKQGFESCYCAKRFSNICGMTFERICHEKYGTNYSTDITPEIQEEMEKICKDFKGNFPKPPVSEEKKNEFESMASIASRVIPDLPFSDPM